MEYTKLNDRTSVEYNGALYERRTRRINGTRYMFARYESSNGHVIVQANRWNDEAGSYCKRVHIFNGTAQ